MTAPLPASRDEAAALLLEVLGASCPTGAARLIGSMGVPGAADAWSDIDLRWTVGPEGAEDALRSLRPTLERVGTVESLRVDPEPRADLRLVFVRFQGWPLWWRVDLEVHGQGLGSVDVPDADPWSPGESACMGVVVTLKTLARQRPADAEEQLAHAAARVGTTVVAGPWTVRVGSLLDEVAARSPGTADLVARTRRLAREVLGA
ncbi:hypothetical protein [Nocardioides sp.]|uniref:hypothetical protein n=1 Tax=Nocardioides sp. TaxID=35761 RepID=UPI0037849F74